MLKVNNMMMKENADLAKALSTSQKQIEGAKREINNNKEEIVTLNRDIEKNYDKSRNFMKSK